MSSSRRTPTPSFAFLLAEHLHMTVLELEHRMPNAEYVRWDVYLARKAQRQELATKAAKAQGRG